MLDYLDELYMRQAQVMARQMMDPVYTTTTPINVEDAESVRVGEVYLVSILDCNDLFLRMILPILGPLHQDADVPEIEAPFDHWHIDWRFFPNMLYSVMANAFGKAFGTTRADLPTLALQIIARPEFANGAPQRRALRCVRPHASFNPATIGWMSALEQANKDKRVCNDICPHKGISLVGAAENGNGVRFCPGHGLAWDRAGCLVRQTTW